MSPRSLVASWRPALLGEVAWVRPDGVPDALPVVPLVERDRPVLALPYAHLEAARELAASPAVTLSVSDASFLVEDVPVAWAPATLELEEDPSGSAFMRRLLDQELRKHPPSRTLADTPLHRREHWWYVPRLLLTAVELGPARPFDGPRDPQDPLVSLAARGDLWLVTGRGMPGDADRLPGSAGADAAALLRHGARNEDLEGRWSERVRGRLRDGRLEDPTTTVDGPRLGSGLLGRWDAQRRLEKSCRAGLHSVGA